MKSKALVVSIKGTKLSKLEKVLLSKEKPWGIILFTRNIKNIKQAANLTNSIYKIKSTTLIELYPSDTNLNADFYKYISEQRNLNYYRINCPSDKNNQLILNFNKFEKLLSKLLK